MTCTAPTKTTEGGEHITRADTRTATAHPAGAGAGGKGATRRVGDRKLNAVRDKRIIDAAYKWVQWWDAVGNRRKREEHLANVRSLLDDAALDSDPDTRITARACRERVDQYLAGGPEAGDFDQVFEGPLAEARAVVAARYDAERTAGRFDGTQPQEELTQLAQPDDSDDTRFRSNTATNTQRALERDGSPEAGAGADPTGAAVEAAGEGITPLREDEAARC